LTKKPIKPKTGTSMEHITMSMKECEQVKVFESLKMKSITQREAAMRLRMSDRWVRTKFKRYVSDGEKGIIHKLRGAPSKQRWDAQSEDILIAQLQGEWHGFGPTFAAEKLKELHGIKVSKETVRTSMIKNGCWVPRRGRFKHRSRRERKVMVGIMVQLDGSPHDWFEGRAEKCTLLVFIDDATSSILWLEFAWGESVQALMQATKNYVEKCGIPNSFYTDHGSVFHVNLNNQEGDKKTHWEQAMAHLNIEVVHANSPQAKGRVERCNKTMQDRLIKELRLAKISSILEANEFLKMSDFITKHNAKFAVESALKGDAHRSIELYDLEAIFSIREGRILANDYTISYNKQLFQLHKDQNTLLRPKDKITIQTNLKGVIGLWIRKTKLNFNQIKERPESNQYKEKACRNLGMPYIKIKPWVTKVDPVFSERVG
jgi:hypothetical protein